jgi:hypothetical protein
LAVTLFALLIFALQNYVVQTHIHFEPGEFGAIVAAKTTTLSKVPSPLKSPADDPATCPICQEMALAGHYISPAPIAVFQSFAAVYWPPVWVVRIVAYTAALHPWQSRGPPAA